MLVYICLYIYIYIKLIQIVAYKEGNIFIMYHSDQLIQALLPRNVLSITYSVCLFVALVIQHAMHMRHTVICDLSDCTIFCHIIS